VEVEGDCVVVESGSPVGISVESVELELVDPTELVELELVDPTELVVEAIELELV